MARNDSLATMTVKIAANLSQFVFALDQGRKKLDQFENTAKNIGRTLGGVFTATAIINGIQQIVGVMSEFEVQMSTVKAITGATGKEFDALEQDALKLGRSTKYTATQVGELQVAYGRLGFTTKEILQATRATLDLAAATGEDLAKSADVAGSTVRGFGLDAEETGRVVDVMASSFNKSALGLENFTESMKYVAPIANAANVSVEETTALLAVLADSGIRGSQAGTSLRKIFGDLTKDGRPLQERLAELSAKGITLADSYDEVGRTAQTALLVLSKNTDKTGELTEAFRNASGEAAEMARIMSDNLTGDVTKLSSAFEGLILSFKEGTGPIRSITQSLTEVLNVISSDKVTLYQKFAVAMALITNPRAGFQGVEQINKVLQRQAQLLEEAAKAQQQYITDSATSLLKDYGFNITEITKALGDNKDAFEILAEVESIHNAEVKKSIEDEINRARTVQLTKEELKKLNDELLRRSEIEREARIATLERSQRKDPLTLSGFTDLGNINVKGNPIAAIQDAITEATKRANEEQKKQIDTIIQQREAWASLGSQMSDVIAQTIASGEPLLNSLARIASGVIAQLERIALARMIADSAKFGIGGIVAAAAGFGIIKGLFSKLSRERTTPVSAPSYQSSGYSQYGMSTVRVYQRGTDMEGTLTETQRLGKRTKG